MDCTTLVLWRRAVGSFAGKCCFLAFLEVQGNYLTVLAYCYTALTSVVLFDALATPSAIVLPRILLRRQHTAVHLVGVLMCMSGVIYNAMADYESDLEAKDVDRHDGSKQCPHKIKITGDLMAILGGKRRVGRSLCAKNGGTENFGCSL